MNEALPTARPCRPAALTVLVCSIFLLLLVPRLASYGMFLDGVTYAAIGRNLAQGTGHFWLPHYTQTLYPIFFEHPPLVFWCLGQLYGLLGDSLYIEAGWGLAVGVFTLGCCIALWRELGSKSGAWWPCLLFACMPLTSWVFTNNMLEGPLTVCTTAACWACARGLGHRTSAHTAWLWGVLAAAGCVAGFLCKGPAALFVVAVPCLLRRACKASYRRLGLVQGGLALGLAACAGAVLRQPQAQAFLAQYWEQQVSRGLWGLRETRASHLYIVGRLLAELLIPVGLTTLLTYLGRARLSPQARGLGLCALAASLPVALSAKQNGWYIFASLPLYALALAHLTDDAAAALQARVLATHARHVWTLTAACLLMMVVGTLYEAGRARKHVDFHQAFTQQPLQLNGALVQVCNAKMLTDYSLHANMARQFAVSLTAAPAPLLLVDRRADCVVPASCQLLHPLKPARLALYRCETTAVARRDELPSWRGESRR